MEITLQLIHFHSLWVTTWSCHGSHLPNILAWEYVTIKWLGSWQIILTHWLYSLEINKTMSNVIPLYILHCGFLLLFCFMALCYCHSHSIIRWFLNTPCNPHASSSRCCFSSSIPLFLYSSSFSSFWSCPIMSNSIVIFILHCCNMRCFTGCCLWHLLYRSISSTNWCRNV